MTFVYYGLTMAAGDMPGSVRLQLALCICCLKVSSSGICQHLSACVGGDARLHPLLLHTRDAYVSTRTPLHRLCTQLTQLLGVAGSAAKRVRRCHRTIHLSICSSIHLMISLYRQAGFVFSGCALILIMVLSVFGASESSTTVLALVLAAAYPACSGS